MEQQIHQVLRSGEALTLAGQQISAQTTNVEDGVTRLQYLLTQTSVIVCWHIRRFCGYP